MKLPEMFTGSESTLYWIVLLLLFDVFYLLVLRPVMKGVPWRESIEHYRLLILDFADSIILAVNLVIFIIRPFVVHAFFIPSPSMEPALRKGDRILVNKFIYQVSLDLGKRQFVLFRVRPPRRQEIVVFHAPKEALQESGYREQKEYIKRVIGIPGDLLWGESGKVFINGRALDEPYVEDSFYPDFPQGSSHWDRWQQRNEEWKAKHGEEILVPNPYRPGKFCIKVPKRHYFVMGDNRNNSSDSRVWGFLHEDALVGKALLRWWPPLRFGMLHSWQRAQAQGKKPWQLQSRSESR